MRTAVIRVNVDPSGTLTDDQLRAGVDALTARGFELTGTRLEKAPPRRRELEFMLTGEAADALRDQAVAACAHAFGATPVPGTVTYISRGTDEDAMGVVAAFGATAELTRLDEDGEEVAVFTLRRADMAHVAESRLHTALEAALNCEVRIVVV
jgi:hypothetical protein